YGPDAAVALIGLRRAAAAIAAVLTGINAGIRIQHVAVIARRRHPQTIAIPLYRRHIGHHHHRRKPLGLAHIGEYRVMAVIRFNPVETLWIAVVLMQRRLVAVKMVHILDQSPDASVV